MKIAVDAMGGDHAPQVVVAGVEQARDRYPEIEFDLYGDPKQVTPLIQDQTRLQVIPTTEIIEMGEEPVRAIRKKKDSSIVQAATAVKEGRADAFFSAGNTGAILAAGLLIVGRIKGIDRPGLTSILPITQPGSDKTRFVYLDTGANAEAKTKNVLQYAIMGKFYAENVLKVTNPRIALLNNGAEEDKGDSFHKEVWQLLNQNTDLNFVGNVEAGDLLYGKADVIVSDGWTANAALKATEGTAKMFMTLIKDGVKNGGLRALLGAWLLKPALKRIKSQMSTSTYGGAVLLGLKAPVVKTHGSSDAEAIKNTIAQIKQMIDSNVIGQTVDYFSADQTGEKLDN